MQILDFVKDYWVLVVVGLVVVFLIRVIFKSLFKIAALALVVGLVLVYVFHYSPEQVLHIGGQATGVAT
ncbi:MAG: TcpD family membrane protein, partial [Tumebacillaceae bacterium]